MLLGELGKLHQLRDDLLDIIAVGAVYQGGGHRVQDGLVSGLEAPWGDRGRKAERKLSTDFCFQDGSSTWAVSWFGENVAGAAQPGGVQAAQRERNWSAHTGWAKISPAPSTAPLRAQMGGLWVSCQLCASFQSPVQPAFPSGGLGMG